jgi:YVTN family beta-propeller protein
MARVPPLAICVLLAAAAPLFGRQILYVDDSGGDDISVVDVATRRTIGSIDVGAAPHGLMASPDGKWLYVSSEGTDRLLAIDTATAKVVWGRPLTGTPNEISISPDGRYVFVPIRSSDHLDVVDTRLRRLVKSIVVGKSPHNTFRSANGKWIYATSMAGSTIALVDIASLSVVGKIPVPGEPRVGAFTSDDRHFYIQLTALHGYVDCDVPARKQLAFVSLPTPDVPVSPWGYTPSHGMAMRPGDRELWATSVFGGAVDVFSLPGNTLITTIPVGDDPNWITFTPDGKYVFVSNPGSHNVSMIDPNAKREIARIPTGRGPKRVYVAEVPAGMDGPDDAGWKQVAKRPPSGDFCLKGGGLISCETSSFAALFESGRLSAETAPAFYRKLGLRGMELDARYVPAWDRASLDRILVAVHSEGRLLTALCADGSLVSDDPDANDRQLAEDRRFLRAARYLGVPVVRLGLGEAHDPKIGLKRAMAAVRQLLPLARELDVKIAFENGTGPTESADNIVRLIQATDARRVGLCLNFRNWPSQDALRAAMPKLAPYVVDAHVRCAAYDSMSNERTIDYVSVLPELSKAGYGGALAVGFDGTADPVKGVEGMRDLLVKLWKGPGTTTHSNSYSSIGSS